MSELFEKSIRTLELPAVLELLARHAVSDEAKARCLRLRPATDAAAVEHLLDETDAAKTRLGLHGSPSFAGVKDVSQALDRADHGGVLNTRELLDVAGVLTAARRVSDYDAERQGEATAIDRLFSALHVNRYLEDKYAAPYWTKRPSPTPPARSWRTYGGICALRPARDGRSCSGSSRRPPTPRCCRRR